MGFFDGGTWSTPIPGGGSFFTPTPATPTTGTGTLQSALTQAGPQVPATGTKSTDPNYIQAILKSWSASPGADPILKTPEGISYYTQKIIESGGLGSDNLGYWQNKSTLASYGGAVGAGNLSSLGSGPGPFTPTTTPFTPATYTPTTFHAPDAFVPPDAFVAPTLDNTNDPGYQFRLDQGAKAYQNSAASKGTLLTGGTLKGLTDYNQNAASAEYSNVFNRALTTQQNSYNQGLSTQQNLYNQLYGTNALNNSTGLAATQANNASGLAANQNAFGQELQTHSTNYSDLYNLANLGMMATTSSYA